MWWVLLIIVLLVISLFVLLLIFTYNRFQQLKNAAEATFRQIQVALKKRLDMIEQLVEATKGYMQYEKGVLERVTELRSRIGSGNVNQVMRESGTLLSQLIAVIENYPELKANENVRMLMKAIRDIENEIARQRYTYNNIVQEYNTMIDTFPSNIVASLFGFRKLEYLEFGEEIERRPVIRLT